MNNLIQQLVDKAKQNVPAGLAPEQWLEVYHKTFAELIVRECADIANQWQVSEHPGLLVRDVIIQHFGVEE